MSDISFAKNSDIFRARHFIQLIEAVGWAKKDRWPEDKIDSAIQKVSSHYTAWIKNEVVGLVRVMSDDLIFTCIPEILIAPQNQSQGIGTRLMEMVIADYGHTIIFLGAQPGNEKFFENLGFQKGPQSYEKCFRPAKKI